MDIAYIAALEQAARTGEADIIQVAGQDVPDYAAAGDLVDLMDYKHFWDYEGNLTETARRAMHSMGPERLYAIPADFTQNAFFYRADWMESYNEAQEVKTERAFCQWWSQVPDASQKLGARGRLAMDRNKLDELFDTVIWSGVGAGVPADLCVAYFGKGDPQDTIFSGEKIPQVMELFTAVRDMLLEDGLSSQEEAVAAFVEGRAGFLFAEASVERELAAKMPQGSWSSAGMPLGEGDAAVAPFDWWGWGLAPAVKEREKAIHFLEYMTNCDNNTHLAKVCGYLPIYREALSMEPSLMEGVRPEENPVEIFMLRDASSFRYACRPEMYAGCEQFGELLNQLLEENRSGEEMARELDAFWLEEFRTQGMLWADEEAEG